MIVHFFQIDFLRNLGFVDFGDYFGHFLFLFFGVISTFRVFSLKKETKIGSKKPKNLQNLSLARGLILTRKGRIQISLDQKGRHYDLREIYHNVKAQYFPDEPILNICWFGNPFREAFRCRKLGLYCLASRTVKIHRLLDHPSFPPYFISYVVYHEILHSVCPPIKGAKGKFFIHHPEFRRREKEFIEYSLVKRWEKEHLHLFFKQKQS